MCGKMYLIGLALVVFMWAAYFSVMGVIVYVAYHFISKFW